MVSNVQSGFFVISVFLVKGSSSKQQFENWSRAPPLTDRAEPVQRLHGSSSKYEFEKLGGVEYCHLEQIVQKMV